jgi:hypothetical protein
MFWVCWDVIRSKTDEREGLEGEFVQVVQAVDVE